MNEAETLEILCELLSPNHENKECIPTQIADDAFLQNLITKEEREQLIVFIYNSSSPVVLEYIRRYLTQLS